MKSKNRMTRINDEMRRELGEIIRSELKDPRIGVLTSVVRAETTQDLKFCKVFISVLGNEEEKKSAMEGIKSASGYIRRLIAERINLRATPELIFKLDDSLEYSIRMSKLIDDISQKESPKEEGEDE